MLRIFVALVIIGFLAPATRADVVMVKDRGDEVKLYGIKSEIDGVKVTVDNVRGFIQESDGVIATDDYDGVGFKRNERATKIQTFPRDQVVGILYKEEPAALLDGFDAMQTGAWAQAISAFRDAYENQELRAVFRFEAYFQIGICYVSTNNFTRAIEHFQKWPTSKSKYTPEAYRILAEIFTAKKNFDAARAEYKKIEDLANISDSWKYRASLGAVKVAIAERKYSDAEQGAKRIASLAGTRSELVDARCLALALQAQAILESGDKERLGEAEKLVREATSLKGVSNTNAALAHLILGHVLYAGGKGLEARFPYMRVVCLYPDERSYVASALQNAGQIFLDLSEGAPDAAASDEFLMKGMKLLAECGLNYRGTEAAGKATSAYRKYRARYEALKAKAESEGEQGGGTPDEDAGEKGK
jgi:tetratricopeptide (TPR) repeat protein